MAAYVHLQNPQVHFVWVGSGPLEDKARQLGQALGFEHVLHFAGQRSDVQAILQTLDCFVLPSLWEGFPIVLLEAMAVGVPIVATDISGNAEMIRSGVDGMLVPPQDPCGLAFAVLDVLNNPSLAESFRQSSRERIEKEFTRQRMLNEITRLYQDTINDVQMKTSGESSQQVIQ